MANSFGGFGFGGSGNGFGSQVQDYGVSSFPTGNPGDETSVGSPDSQAAAQAARQPYGGRYPTNPMAGGIPWQQTSPPQPFGGATPDQIANARQQLGSFDDYSATSQSQPYNVNQVMPGATAAQAMQMQAQTQQAMPSQMALPPGIANNLNPSAAASSQMDNSYNAPAGANTFQPMQQPRPMQQPAMRADTAMQAGTYGLPPGYDMRAQRTQQPAPAQQPSVDNNIYDFNALQKMRGPQFNAQQVMPGQGQNQMLGNLMQMLQGRQMPSQQAYSPQQVMPGRQNQGQMFGNMMQALQSRMPPSMRSFSPQQVMPGQNNNLAQMFRRGLGR